MVRQGHLYQVASQREFEKIIEDVDEYYGAQWLNEIERTGESYIDILAEQRDKRNFKQRD